jgi:CxxC motif-containing protein
MEGKEIICIVCPMGCQMEVCGDAAAGYNVKGNACSRGEKYGIKELSDPTRVLTTTVRLKSKLQVRLPVRSDGPVPKGMIFPCMKLLDSIVTEAPVSIGTVIVENILGTGANIVAARSIR